jgi:hypothetical protein
MDSGLIDRPGTKGGSTHVDELEEWNDGRDDGLLRERENEAD